MGERCDFKLEAGENTGACLVTVAPGKEILYGRMLRNMVRNLSRRFDLFEYSIVRGQKEVEASEDVVASIPVGGSSFLPGKQNYVIFQQMHPSFTDETYMQLEPEDEEHFRLTLSPGEEFVRADFTVSIPNDFYAVITDDIDMLVQVLGHIKPNDFDAVREAITRLSPGNIGIFDEAEMLVEFSDPVIPSLLAEGNEAYLCPMQQVDQLGI